MLENYRKQISDIDDEITRLFEQVFPGYTIKWG